MLKRIVPFLTTVSVFLLMLSCTQPSAFEKAGPLDKAKIDRSQTRIVIEKQAYQLHLYEKDNLLKTYPVVFGFNPVDDKMQSGDGCTPEGTFKIKTQYPHKSWSRFIWVDYPNAASQRKFQAHKEAGLISREAKIGGEIGIHGVPSGYDWMIEKKENWTLGCISLTNADIIELYDLVQDGTRIDIRK